MKNKLIQMLKKPSVVENKGVKYSVLLEQFIAPFVSEFAEVEFYDEIFEFAITAWNFGNMKLVLPEGELDKMVSDVSSKDVNKDLLGRMIDYKVSHFNEYTSFIADHELNEKNGEPVLTVVTQSQDGFLEGIFKRMEDDDTQSDYEDNYIDRCAIIIKPLQPFLDWYSGLYPDSSGVAQDANTYLISEDIEDVEAWLRKKFDKIFEFELESLHDNKKEWPQKRSYKMFKEWFQVDVSKMVYDFEHSPIYKS